MDYLPPVAGALRRVPPFRVRPMIVIPQLRAAWLCMSGRSLRLCGAEQPKGAVKDRVGCVVKTRKVAHMKFEQATQATIAQLWTTVEPRVELATCLEEAAQALAKVFSTP